LQSPSVAHTVFSLFGGAAIGMLFMVSLNASIRQRRLEVQWLWPMHRIYRSPLEEFDELVVRPEFRMSPETLVMYVKMSEQLATHIEEARRAKIVAFEVGAVVLISLATLILVSGQNVIESATDLSVGALIGALVAQVIWLAVENSLGRDDAVVRVLDRY